MKTAISLPDHLFDAAEETARRLGVSRSQLYARAVAEYLAKTSNEGITEALDAIYRDVPSALDPVMGRMQLASIAEEDW